MAYTHKGSFGHDHGVAIDGDDAFNKITNRKEDLDRQLKTDQVRDQVAHPGNVSRPAPK